MSIVVITFAVIVAMCTAFVLLLGVGDVCRAAREPELLVFDEPLAGGVDFCDGDETSPEQSANLREAV